MRERSVTLPGRLGGLRLSYLEWGDEGAERVVLCVHGLTRNAHDFEGLAAGLIQRAALRVLAFDVAGRGRSDWLADPEDYDVERYAEQLLAALDVLAIERVDWIGTSMGGLIGLVVAAGAPERLEHLVLNDIGPYFAAGAFDEIAAYLRLDPVFENLAEFEGHLREIHAEFGALSDAQWRRMAETSARRDPDGWRPSYDPAIREVFLDLAGSGEFDLWELYDAIATPTGVIRGARSALLDPATARAMTERGPRARLATIEGAGHAPFLASEEEIEVVARFLDLE